MPTYVVTDPDTGLKLRLTGDSPPTEEELEQLFSVANDQRVSNNNGDMLASGPNMGPQARAPERRTFPGQGVGEAAATLISGAVAEPVAGLAGLVELARSGDSSSAADAVQHMQSSLTYSPKTEGGKEAIQTVGEPLQAAAEFFDSRGLTPRAAGEAVTKSTGSPVLGTIVATLPAAALELGLMKGAGGTVRRSQRAAQTRLLEAGAPEINQLFDASRAVYKEIDGLGLTMKPDAFKKLTSKITDAAKDSGARQRTTPEIFGALEEFNDIVKEGRGVPLGEVDELRKVVQKVAEKTDRSLTSSAVAMIDEMDEFLDVAGTSIFDNPSGAKIGQRYRAARQLWGRARKAELIEEVFTKSDIQASGFENGLRNNFRAVVNNKRQARYFRKDEIDAMRRVVKGDRIGNAAKLMGRFGFSEAQATNVLGGFLGSSAGYAVGGPVGAVSAGIAGQVSREWAQRLTVGNARFAESLVRSGKDGAKIVKAYMRNVPKAKRSADDLANLLLDPAIDLNKVGKAALAKDAADIAAQNRAALAAVLANAPEEEK